MDRSFGLSMIGLLVLGLTGCGRDSAPPVDPVPQMSDSQLQQMEEDEIRTREEQSQVD